MLLIRPPGVGEEDDRDKADLEIEREKGEYHLAVDESGCGRRGRSSRILKVAPCLKTPDLSGCVRGARRLDAAAD